MLKTEYFWLMNDRKSHSDNEKVNPNFPQKPTFEFNITFWSKLF